MGDCLLLHLRIQLWVVMKGNLLCGVIQPGVLLNPLYQRPTTNITLQNLWQSDEHTPSLPSSALSRVQPRQL